VQYQTGQDTSFAQKKKTLTKQTNNEMQDNASGQREKNATRKKKQATSNQQGGYVLT